ncbi:baseplate wedge subunit [Synechococcus phage S-B68]|nr:baseplate wedge subunit [Synechococcus phage S-B68]
MAGAIQLTSVDFDQIKENLVSYLKSTGAFTDYDFDGSNLQVILNLISYQAQLNAYSTNMIANESFLASASLRNNVVANARMVGFTPTSARAAHSQVSLDFQLDVADYPSGFPQYLQIQPGITFTVDAGIESLVFNCIDPQTAAVTSTGLCQFSEVKVFEGTFLTSKFTVDKSDYNQRFVIENRNIDTTSIRVEIQEDPNQQNTEFYIQAENLVELTDQSRVYWLEEVNDGFYELSFGDGFFGKALVDGAVINITYVATNGTLGNGVSGSVNYRFVGRTLDSFGTSIQDNPTILSASTTEGGAEIEDVSSVKFRAPRDYASQQRCVIAEDYASIIRDIYPAAEDIYVFGGEELEIPEYGRVYVVIKPSTGSSISAVTKNYIKKSLQKYRIASLDIVLIDADILNVEVVSSVFFNDKRTLKDNAAISATVRGTLTEYANSSTVSRFGGAVRYSRVLGVIDDSDKAITRNNTSLRMRKDAIALLNTSASYEICFENELKKDTSVSCVYSSGFQLKLNGSNDGVTYYFEDDGLGALYRFHLNEKNEKVIDDTGFGTVDYTKGEIKIGYTTPITFVNTTVSNSTIEVRAIPVSQDIIAKRSVAINFDIAKSDIVSVIDTEIAGS